MTDTRRIGIIGLGLIGGSIALSLGGKYDIVGFDTDEAACDIAAKRGICTVVRSVKDMRDCAVVFVCVPVFAMREALVAARDVLPDDVTVADVASVKAPFEGLIAGYVGTHPMAGLERGGISQAKSNLFKSAYWVVTDKGEAADRVRKVIADTGATALYMSASEHDRAVARFSHVPHAIAYALVKSATDSGAQPIAGSGFLDTTRIAQSDGKFWATVFGLNAKHIRDGLSSMRAELAAIDGMLERGNIDELEKYFTCARNKRAALNKSDLGGEALYVDLVDRVGEFERVTGAIARAGINVTNIALVPGREGVSGALRLEFADANDKVAAARVLGISEF